MTRPHEIEQLRRRMGEAAALPADDPRRQAVVNQISAQGGMLEREWLDLLQQDEQMRIDLARIDPPVGLQGRLLAIMDQAHPRAFRPWFLRTRWLMTAAALLVACIGLAALLMPQYPLQAQTMRSLASVAMASHEAHPQVTLTASDWNDIRETLGPAVPFDIQPPQLPADIRLVGASVTTLAGANVLYSRWEEADGTLCSVFQFCAADFGLKRPLPREVIIPQVGTRSGRPFEVILWSEGHCDYALVRKTPPQTSPENRHQLQAMHANYAQASQSLATVINRGRWNTTR